MHDSDTITYPALNVSLIRDLLRWAKGERDGVTDKLFAGWGGWDQTAWGRQIVNGVCQTSYCMAGQAVVQEGYTLLFEEADYYYEGDDEAGNPIWKRQLTAAECAPTKVIGTDDKGHPIHQPIKEAAEMIETVGARVLGLTDSEASDFFYADNTYETLVEHANFFARCRDLDVTFD